jgi:hypothetical protein
MVLPKGLSLATKVEFAAGEGHKLDGSKAAARFAKYKGSTTLREALSLGATGKDIHFDIEHGLVKRAAYKRQRNRIERPLCLPVAAPLPDSPYPILAISLASSDEGRQRRLALEHAFYAIYRSGLTWVDAVTPEGVQSWNSYLHRANP